MFLVIGDHGGLIDEHLSLGLIRPPDQTLVELRPIPATGGTAIQIVTTDVPGCREAVTQDVNGLLVPVRNADALANALQSLLEDPQRRMRLGMAGRRRAEEEFGLERVVAQTLALYDSILGVQRRPAVQPRPA